MKFSHLLHLKKLFSLIIQLQLTAKFILSVYIAPVFSR